MICKIADLIVDVPQAGGMPPRCRDYLWDSSAAPDITVCTELYQPELYPYLNDEDIAYIESGRVFHTYLVYHGGMYLHASAVALDGRAYLFSADPGTGKSTHTRLWQQLYGDAAQVINDDKPTLRCIDGTWYAYGTPWCGKDGINRNVKVPLAGICFLKQAGENKIRRLDSKEAMPRLLMQTLYKFHHVERLDLMIGLADKLLRQIPMFELENRPEPDAARLSYETMRRAAEEAGL